MFFCVSQDLYATLTSYYSLSGEDSFTPDGLILNPSQAGQCLPEIQRTKAFVNGLDEAVQQKKAEGCSPVKIFYAGCGPFSTLVLPLMLSLIHI